MWTTDYCILPTGIGNNNILIKMEENIHAARGEDQ
jgi:hypothetical protein